MFRICAPYIYQLVIGIALPGYASSVTTTSYLEQVNQELLIGQSKLTRESLAGLREQVESHLKTSDPAKLRAAREGFAKFVAYWRALETVYVAGALQDEFIDHPGIIDHFHQGHVSIEKTMAPIWSTNKKLTSVMFKSSSKSINAIEYLLFVDKSETERRWQALLLAINHVERWLAEIGDFYRDSPEFTDGDVESLEKLINVLVNSSYRLSHWRLGEPAGLVGKYKDKPDPERLEYYRSGLSMPAVVVILETHAEVFDIGLESDYFSEQGRAEGVEEIIFVREKIQVALDLARRQAALAQPDQVESSEFQELFKACNALYKAYYFLLVKAMGLRGRFVDAEAD